ncbi:MAG: glycine cleavage system protein GcvH [Candidatus Thermoplasmatota archaeon]
MSNEIKKGLRYTKSHEWVKTDGKKAVVGITDHAQEELTDIVFVELPSVGDKVKKGDELCVVESVKSVSEIYSPISGEITNINEKLEEEPETINENPYDEGWLVEIEIEDESELEDLLSSDEYKEEV